ncbi:hypothetical protein [Rhodocyclus tenuis]|uniref:hypothetical protein n=1 Tax=Rhodocyclus tenuis TaxID=1066 RepID=UPI00190402E6|nr:hypothetical protein [Rhodocyclus tenuis]
MLRARGYIGITRQLPFGYAGRESAARSASPAQSPAGKECGLGRLPPRVASRGPGEAAP